MSFDFWTRIDDQAVKAGLQQLAELGQDMRPVMRDLSRLGEASTRMRFRTQIDPDGRPWAVSNRVAAKGGRTLTLDGHLGDSLSSRYGARYAEWGVNRVYAAIHQFGGVIRPRNARYLAIPLNEKARIAGSPRNLDVELVFVETDSGKFLLDPLSETFMYVLVGQVTIPARAYLGISADDRDDMLDAIQHRIEGATPNA